MFDLNIDEPAARYGHDTHLRDLAARGVRYWYDDATGRSRACTRPEHYPWIRHPALLLVHLEEPDWARTRRREDYWEIVERGVTLALGYNAYPH